MRSSMHKNIDKISEDIVDQYMKKGLINFDTNQSFIDKSLENFFCLGWLIKIFPNAKIINIKRFFYKCCNTKIVTSFNLFILAMSS